MSTSVRRATLALGLALAVSGAARAQGDTANSDPDRLFILMQGYAAPTLSGAGLSSAFDVGVADVGGLNPAALGSFAQAAAGLTYQFETSIAEGYVAEIGYDPMNGVRPQSAGFALPLGPWVLGVSYQQRYAAEMDFGCIPVRSESEDVYCATQFARMETVSPQVAYRTTLAGGADLAVGARLGVGVASAEGAIDAVRGTFRAWGTQVAVGVQVRSAHVGLAAYYESALRVEGTMAYEGEGLPPIGGPTNPGGIIGSTFDLPTADALPARLAFSAELVASPTLRFGTDLARVFWKAAWDDGDQFKDQSEAAVWVRRDLSADALVSAGLLYRGRNRWDNGFDEIFGYSGRAIYLTAGGVLTLGGLRLDAVVADSHLLSADEHRQTIVKLGASVVL